jgi:DNA modification methylase
MDYRIIEGDCIEGMRRLEGQSVNCVVTSPPYFGLRDYGRDGQIGLEASPDAFVAKLVDVFREVRRVLRDDGTLWLNLGDSYGSAGGNTYSGFNERWSGTGGEGSKQDATLQGVTDRKPETGLRPKNLLGIPWRVAFALQADGWYLRQDIIWHKPNPMPESVTDRCTKAHEYIFLLSKSERYYFDSDAMQEPSVKKAGVSTLVSKDGKDGILRNDANRVHTSNGMRNRRSVWTVTTKPYSGAHFATFPPDLIRPCILAGCPKDGTVLDPFGGSGTTALVALEEGRKAVLCELNTDYIALAHKRLEGLQLRIA